MSKEKETEATDDKIRKQRERIDRLLAETAVARPGTVALASGQVLAYTVSAQFIPVHADGVEAGEPQAAVMVTSYQQTDAAPGSRAVCFAFNGGPGSSSIWLQLGALGPRRVTVPDDGTPARPPHTLADNPHCWLDLFDLVFIDPPHTGWSVALDDDARKKFLSVDGDVQALAEVMRVWLTRHKRWGSVLYLAGESYGTTRAAALADKMQASGMDVSGVVLVSCAMDLQSLEFSPRNDLPYALFLPAFANTAQFHGLLKGSLAQSPAAARAAAESFVADDYLVALHAGARLTAAQRRRTIRRVAELTGLPAALIEAQNMRISDETFFFEALREQGRIVGRLDSRGTAPMAASRTRTWEFDPGLEAIVPAYTMAALDFYSSELGISREQRYEVLSPDVIKQWNWNRGEARGNNYACTSTDLARAMRRNAHLKVLAASGRYDLGTPYSASDWSLAQLDAPSDVLARVTHRYYDAGHMMYTRQADLVQLKSDVSEWLAT